MTSTTSSATGFTTSADGTRIAFEARGSGPALVLVDGAMCHRSLGPSRDLADALAGSFTVHVYDRRGRGESGPGSWPYDVASEVEDLQAVIRAAGGRAHVLGVSSGAALALEAARRGAPLDRLALYEAPFIVDDTHPAIDPRLPARLQGLVEEGRRGEAVGTFLRTVGVPAPFVLLMRVMPAWRKMTATAHTLPYDFSIVVDQQQGRPLPPGCYEDVEADTLVLVGGKSPVYMRNAQAAVAAAVPGARLEVLPGQTHMVRAKAVAPVLTGFLKS
jgi:pimeloyl-ACP methyl ester carboxylesterase